MLRIPKTLIHRTMGFSLVEVMVGLVIGMLALIVMMQVFSLSEERKRNATSGGDAQSNGAIMFNQLQRDIGQAGYGFSAINLFGCNVTWKASGAYIATAVPLAPVTINPSTSIIPAGDLNTDTLLVLYGNTNGEPQGNPIAPPPTTNIYAVQMASAFTVGDKVIVAPATVSPTTPCTTSLWVDKVAATPVGNTVTTLESARSGASLYNLGPAPIMLAYAVRNGNLTMCDYTVNDCGLSANKNNDAIWVPMASNIVSMKAVYGKDVNTPTPPPVTQKNYIVDSYNQTPPTTACGWARIPAVSLVLVSRSTQYEKDVVTMTALNAPSLVNAPTWTQNSVAPIVGATGSLGPDAAVDEVWKHYRYKVFQAVVPIRNVAWMGVSTGC